MGTREVPDCGSQPGQERDVFLGSCRLTTRMGHAQITTTQKYLHALPDADAKNLTALDRIRDPAAPGSPQEPTG